MIWKPAIRSLILLTVIIGITCDNAWSGGPPIAPYVFAAFLAASLIQLVVNIVRWRQGFADSA